MSRIFLVGSGPSLKHTDINALAGEDVMVMNKYGRVAKELGFTIKPKYYFKIDHNTVDQTQLEEIGWARENCEHLYLWEKFKTGHPEGHPNHDVLPEGTGDIPNTTWIKKCSHEYNWPSEKIPTSWHLPELCTGLGGMSTMMQIAYTLGYAEIYLLGCDLGYTPHVDLNHAIPNYTKDERDKSEMDNGNMLALHKMAKRSCPVPIYNATVGGELEVYPRVKLQELL